MSRTPATRVIAVDATHPDPAALDLAAHVLTGGGLVAFATETVYGLGAVATQPAAVERIFAAKGRPAKNPLIVHVSGIPEARACTTDWPADAQRLAEHFWPGPLTLVLFRHPVIPDVVAAGLQTVALRSPRGGVARGLIERVGQPIAAPSANRSNSISATRAEHVLADLENHIDLVIDSGPTSVGIESTVLDLSGRSPRILRPGPITRAELEEALAGRAVLDHAPREHASLPMSPGQMPVHYAPRTPAYHVASLDELEGLDKSEAPIALIVVGKHSGAGALQGSADYVLDTSESATKSLYDVLHRCDALARREIVVVLPPDVPEWRAVRDRLMRACRPLSER